MNRTRFSYCDFWPGKGQWRRIKISEIEDRAKKSKFYNVFASIQNFEIPQHIDGEMTFGPVYFDLDSDSDVNIALQDARKLIQFFSDMGINQEFVHSYFSGKKGFHIVIEPEIFGIEPHSELAYIIKHAAYNLKTLLKLTSVDMQAYSVRRLLRIPNSVHQATGKYKIELYHNELMNKSMDEINNLAVSPRESLYDPIEYSGMQPDAAASQWWQEVVNQYSNQETLHKLRPRQPIVINSEKYPDCVAFLLGQTSLPQSHTGNKAILALGSYFKDAGKSVDQTIEVVTKWISNVDNCGDAGKVDKLKSMVTATVNCIYEKPNEDHYHFACSFIRALSGADKKIPCAYDKCSMVANPTDQEPETPLVVHLSEASRAEYKGHKLTISAMIAGKDGSPYIIPKEIIAKCNAEKKDENCFNCLLKDTSEYQYEFTAKDEEMLSFINVDEPAQKNIIRRKLKVGCKRCHITFKSNTNMETVRLVPVVDDSSYGAQQHVVRVCQFLGHGIKLNQKYVVKAYTYAHPKDQRATHLISEAEADNTSLDNFKMTQELHKQLSVFQPGAKQTVYHKFEEIHEDFEVNIHKIWHRRIMAWAIDLVYHSPLQYSFQGQFLQRGWCEVLIVGDSGQGKSKMIEAMQKHYGLGEGATGESATRTGLMYNFQSSDKTWMLQWGRIPLNDRGLLYIDEMSGLSPEDISKMSYMRSNGRILLHGIISDETNARTRLIFLSNPREGRTLNTFNHGVEAIRTIIPFAEDVRRLDFALAVASGEVSVDTLNRKDSPKLEHTYTSYLCKNLILWAWSRKPDQIIFTHEAENLILDRAVEMSKKYSSKIPLVEPADQRVKLARLSAAAAARTFSTDDKGNKIIVTEDHVNFVHLVLGECYDSSSMGYDIFSQETNAKSFLTSEQKKTVTDTFLEFREPKRLREIMLRTNVLNKNFFVDMLGYTPEESKSIMRFMTINNLIENKRGMYFKTPHFIQFLKELVLTNVPEYQIRLDDENQSEQ